MVIKHDSVAKARRVTGKENGLSRNLEIHTGHIQ